MKPTERDKKKIEFLNKHNADVLRTGVDNRDSVGFVRAYASENFELWSLKFVKESFNPNYFAS